MAEVFAAFGTLSAFLQVVDFAAKLASKAYELSRANRDALREDIELERLAREYKAIAEECSSAAERANEDEQPKPIALFGQNEAGRRKQIVELGQECQKKAQDLLNELEGFRVEASGSKVKRAVEGTRNAARMLVRQKAIDKQRRQLQELNTLLATHMLQDLWKRGQFRASKRTQDLAIPHAKNVDEVRLVVARNNIREVLAKLEFSEMSTRQQSVETAWQQTYSWALEHSPHGFATWLQHGHGIFWISGKAGSGKSTLMKYLCHHHTTKEFLQQWSGTRKLVFASFFFWYAGTSLQKSITGLLRSILHQILYEVPSLARIAFPRDVDGETDIEWTDDDLFRGLEAITRDNEGHMAVADRVFCFFVDGLDEYEGDHFKLTSLLKALVNSSNIKICVSSRPWNAFRSAFDQRVLRLRLEDLTRSDIVHYASDKIRGRIAMRSPTANSDPDIDELILEIAERAEGVFLWVILAVKSVCEGIVEGDNVAFLQHRVRSFPRDLEDFFRKILQRVDPIYKQQTSQALKLAWLSVYDDDSQESPDAEGDSCQRNYVQTESENNVEDDLAVSNEPEKRRRDGRFKALSSFIDFWLIRQYPQGLGDTQFAYEGDVSYVSGDSLSRMKIETKSFLSAACKDLLCLPKVSDDLLSNKVEFLHRTVYDFLSTSDMRRVLDDHLPLHFKNRRVLHLLNLKRLKYVLASDLGGLSVTLLKNSAAMSLTSSHPDLCERYVQQFDDIFLDYLHHNLDNVKEVRQLRFFRSPKIIGTFIAFRQHRYVFELLDHYITELLDREEQNSHRGDFQRLLIRRPDESPLWAAALGESPVNTFALSHINFDLVKRLLNDRKKVTSLHERSMDSGVWQSFFARWKLSNPPSCHDPSSRCSEYRHTWELVKLFLQHNEPLMQTLSTQFGYLKFEHNTFIAEEYIRAHVPLDWLYEFGYFAEFDADEVDEHSKHQLLENNELRSVAKGSRSPHSYAQSGNRDNPIVLDGV